MEMIDLPPLNEMPDRIADLCLRVGYAGLDLQCVDGAMPCGRNGPHNHTMTPVRNTGHWAILFCMLHRLTRDRIWAVAAGKALDYIVSPQGRPCNGAFWHRRHPERTSYNGLIGQAWSLEALWYGSVALDNEHYLKIARDVIRMHQWADEKMLWREIDLDGSPRGVGMTLNQQIWFMAMACRCLPNEMTATAGCFLDNLESHSTCRASGLLHTAVHLPVQDLKARLKTLVNILENTWRGDQRVDIDSGYHIFCLLGFALLNENCPGHPVFSSPFFNKIVQYAFSDAYLSRLSVSPFGFPYNMPGFELPAIWGRFFDRLPKTALKTCADLFKQQLHNHFDTHACLLKSNTLDPDTLAARFYEIYRLPNAFWTHLPDDFEWL